jgi:putative oxidoreductase
MKIVTIIVRFLLGLAFIVFGLNAFLNFIPAPPPPEGLAGDFVKVFMASGYAKWIGAFQIIGGLLLFIPRFVPLGLTILGGVIVNILIFHTVMAPEGFGPGLVVAALALFLLWQYRSAFAGLVNGQR